jgi:plasmid stabilization system protein ParE
MKVVITTAARADLAEIQAFIAQDNPARADSFVDELVARCEELTDAPRGYPLISTARATTTGSSGSTMTRHPDASRRLASSHPPPT